IVEWNSNDYEIALDSVSESFGWYGFGGSPGGGERDRYAIGTEWLLPLIDSDSLGRLDLTLAGRWDKYNDQSSVDDARTWKAALQWQVNEDLTLNAVRSSSFRAPDLHYLFADTSLYFTDVIDLEQCINVDGNSFDQCQNNTDYFTSIAASWTGNRSLEEETGSTETLGLRYNPMKEVTLSLDYYDITLENQVGLQLESQYLRWEAQCNAGVDFISGQPVDANTPLCVDTLSRVIRGNGALLGIFNEPVNRALRRQSGFDFAINWFSDIRKYGTFGFDLHHSRILNTTVQAVISEPSTRDDNFQDAANNNEIRNRTNVALSWGLDDTSAVLSVFRKGTQPSSDGRSKLAAWSVVNLVLSNAVTEQQQVTLTVRNLTNKRPPIDLSMMRWPYYDRGQYDAIGRELFLNYQIAF
ncbi:MAG: TonB-dependent receptor, partial [Kangiellaceae bacterium]|nr:TonB-dependent receptor [Kangiellaceae bacterium]